MKPFATCVFVALLSGALATPSSVAKWENFKAKHAKQHPAHEEAQRMQAFLQRDAEIEEHNARFAAGLESFSMRPNQYSDLTPEEFAQSALGFTPAVNASDIPFSSEPMMPNLPSSFDWREKGIMTHVENQLYCGSCYAFAGAGVLEAYLKWKKGNTYDLSEQDVVDCSYRRYGAHNNGCQGGWPTAVFQHYNDKDIVPESQYPYTSGRSRTHGQCRFPRPINNVVRGRLQIKSVRTRSEDETAALLMQKGPLVIAIGADNEYKRFFNDLGDGIFDRTDAINIQPNHAVSLVGFGTQNGTPYWVIKNSWGKEWGMGGYGKIRRGRNMCNMNKFGVFYVEE